MKRGCDNCQREFVCHYSDTKRFKINCKYYNKKVKTSNWIYKGDKPINYFDAKIKKINKDRLKEDNNGST